ncbi:RNA methyltransferase, partial [bacterium]|nr:RNA methyltransferase [bacterium]
MALSKTQIKKYKVVHLSKGRKETGLFLIEGPELIKEALRENWPLLEAALTHSFSESESGQQLASQLELGQVPHEVCSATDMERITDARSPQGAAAIGVMDASHLQRFADQEKEMIVVCEQVSDPGNLGTIIRTADWFGIRRLYIGVGSADPFSPKVVRATAGAIFRVAVVTLTDITGFLTIETENGRQMVAGVMSGSMNVDDLPRAGLRGLVLGHETRGLSPEVESACSGSVRIERYGNTESLNLSVAAG